MRNEKVEKSVNYIFSQYYDDYYNINRKEKNHIVSKKFYYVLNNFKRLNYSRYLDIKNDFFNILNNSYKSEIRKNILNYILDYKNKRSIKNDYSKN